MKPVCICISIAVVIGGAILALFMIGGSDLLREWSKTDAGRNATDVSPTLNALEPDANVLENASLSTNTTNIESDARSTNGNNSTTRYNRVISVLAGKMKEDAVRTARKSGLTQSQVVRGLNIAGISLAIGIAVFAGICLLGPLVTCLCLTCLGYEKPGVAHDSLASRIRSAIGNVEAGSYYAPCQSQGADGFTPIRTIFVTALVAGVFASIITVIVMLINE